MNMGYIPDGLTVLKSITINSLQKVFLKRYKVKIFLYLIYSKSR